MATPVYDVSDSDDVMLYFSCTIGKPMVIAHVHDEKMHDGPKVPPRHG
jgi:hypothetical protein